MEQNTDPITQPAPTEPQVEPPKEQTQPAEPSEPENLTDKHGQTAISKGKYERDLASRDQKIAELQAKLDKAAQDAAALAEVKAEINQVKQEAADERQNWELEKAGCRDIETAKAVIGNYQGDIQALKDAKPWLFESKPAGTTGLKPTGITSDYDAQLAKARKAAGVKSRK